MYHIPNDRRALRSADALYQGLLHCLEKRDYLDVTVQELCEASDISRATFYRLFDNISDVLSWKIETILMETLSAFEGGDTTIAQAMERFVSIWISNRKLMETLIRCQRMTLLDELHRKHLADFRLMVSRNQEIEEIQADYLASILSAILPAAFQVWFKHPEDSPSAILVWVRNSLKLLEGILSDIS